jgi:hypothetical protein
MRGVVAELRSKLERALSAQVEQLCEASDCQKVHTALDGVGLDLRQALGDGCAGVAKLLAVIRARRLPALVLDLR